MCTWNRIEAFNRLNNNQNKRIRSSFCCVTNSFSGIIYTPPRLTLSQLGSCHACDSAHLFPSGGPLVLSRDLSSPVPSRQLLFSAFSRMPPPFIHLLLFTFQTLRPQKMRPQNLRWKPRKVLGGTRTRLDGEELQVSLLKCISNQ